jgi:hypothetical protein
MKSQYFAGQLLMLKQRFAAPVHRAQRSQIGRRDMELLTQMPPEHRWHDAHRIEYSATHAQEPHLQREAQLELRPTAFFNDLAFARREPKNASISKAVSSRGSCFKPKNVACQVSIASS